MSDGAIIAQTNDLVWKRVDKSPKIRQNASSFFSLFSNKRGAR